MSPGPHGAAGRPSLPCPHPRKPSMADYYPLMIRALGALTETSAAMRQAMYNRARKALFDQLTQLEPPLPPDYIARDLLQLENTIRRVENELREFGAENVINRSPMEVRFEPP